MSSEIPENVTYEAPSDPFEEIKNTARQQYEDLTGRINDLNLNQKLILTGVVAFAASVAVQAFGRAKRAIRINAENLIVAEPTIPTDI